MKEREFDLQRFAEGEGGQAGEGSAGEANAGTEAEMAVPVPEELLREKQEKEAEAAPHAEGPPEEPEPEAEGEKTPHPGAAHPPSPQGEGLDTGSEQGEGPETGPTMEERIAALEEALQKQNELLLRREQEIVMRQHFTTLEQQGEAMKEQFPAFDLKAELADPMFVKLTSPMVGLSVEDAYYALHHEQITEAGAQAAAEMLGNSVKAGKAMPDENGTIQRGTPEGFRPLAELSPEERKLRMDLIRSGKLTF